MRLFIGSFATLDSFNDLKQLCSDLDLVWIKEENLHLTYAFFPEIQNPEVISEQLRELDLEHKEIEIKGLGLFGEQILYAQAEDALLVNNYKIIHDRFEGKAKSFEPHITLARIKNYDPTLTQEILVQSQTKHLGRLSSEILLIQSRLTPQGSIYKVLSSSK